MALNQTELISEVASQMVRDDLDTRIAIWLNWGLNRIDRYADLKGLGKHSKCACVVDQTEYAFPTDLKYVRTFRLLDHILTTFATTAVSTVTHIITVDEDITTGTKVILLNADPPAPLVTGTVYFAINLSATTINLATTSALATAGTNIELTDVGSGTHAMEIFESENSRKLEYVPEVTFDIEQPDISTLSQGKAERYIDRGDIFELDIPPDARYVLDIRYVKWQDELTTDEDPEVDFADDLIVAATIVEGWVALGESAKASEAHARFIGLLAAHRAVERLRPDYAPKGTSYSSSATRGNIIAEAYKYPFETLRR